MSKDLDCVVIGGGPAGLSMGYWLSKISGLNFAILEKGDIGQSWRDMHDTLTLLSPMYVNQLPGYRFNPLRWLEKIPKNDFVNYLKRYADRFALPVIPHHGVISIQKMGDGFVVKTTQGDFCSRSVISATGYFSAPYLPETPTDQSIPLMHSAQYQSPRQLEALGIPSSGRVLIVGKRISAGQLLEELTDAGYALGIAIRAPVRTRVGGLWGRMREHLYYAREYLRFRRNSDIKEDSSSLMEGGRTEKILNSGNLTFHSPLDRIAQGRVYFQDETMQQYDLVISATGYRHHLDHLESLVSKEKPIQDLLQGCESVETEGLFFLGLDNLYSFKSRYIRGIATDSQRVANAVIRYLAKT